MHLKRKNTYEGQMHIFNCHHLSLRNLNPLSGSSAQKKNHQITSKSEFKDNRKVDPFSKNLSSVKIYYQKIRKSLEQFENHDLNYIIKLREQSTWNNPTTFERLSRLNHQQKKTQKNLVCFSTALKQKMKTFELLGEELLQVDRKENRRLAQCSRIEKMGSQKQSFVSRKAFRQLFPDDN